jgi:hypothetical protein
MAIWRCNHWRAQKERQMIFCELGDGNRGVQLMTCVSRFLSGRMRLAEKNLAPVISCLHEVGFWQKQNFFKVRNHRQISDSYPTKFVYSSNFVNLGVAESTLWTTPPQCAVTPVCLRTQDPYDFFQHSMANVANVTISLSFFWNRLRKYFFLFFPHII